uniref:Uncharacterized protein n=1 Tax=Candidatus Methanophaga sp. ANME-1 ERB7 TaxID=2759913 RepID=A0A7G9Z901_9EURY|nr:hypothetical protein HGIILDEE_00024 [Methanosarcinales archaeon ANME-1 ERB7]
MELILVLFETSLRHLPKNLLEHDRAKISDFTDIFTMLILKRGNFVKDEEHIHMRENKDTDGRR